MRRLIFILLAIIGVSQAQTIQYIGAPTTTVISRGNFRTDSIFYLPKRTKLPTDTAALRYQISDSSLYAWTGWQWRKVGADADTLVYSTRAWRQKGDDSLAARINLKLNISDTASMLTPYLRKADTTAMLSPYYRTATATAALATKLNISDTSTMLSPYARTATVNASLATKLNISDTSSMLGNYIRHAGYGLTKSGQSFLVDTLNIATRAWRQKGIDSVVSIIPAAGVGGSGTTNYVPKFTAGSTIGNSQIFDNGTNVGINTASPASRLHAFGTSGATTIIAEGATNNTAYGRLEMRGRPQSANQSTGYIVAASTEGGQAATNIGTIDFAMAGAGGNAHYMAFSTHNGSSLGERLRIFANGRVFIGASPTDAGYQLDVNGTLRSVNGANFATTSGNVGIGTASPDTKLNVIGNFQIGNGFNFGNAFTINRNVASLNDAFVIRDSSNLDDIYVLSVNATTGEVRHGANDDNGTGFHTFYAGNQYGMGLTASRELLINTTSDAGDYKLQVAGNIYGSGLAVIGNAIINTNSPFVTGANIYTNGQSLALGTQGANLMSFFTNNAERGRINSAGEWIIDASGTDAGDYKLQVVGNARIGTGKLDIASNTTFGIGVARSGTSEVAGQIYNSNGILYLGAESSTGGQIFSGSSAYAAVIGSGANYPLQFATNNITRATMTTSGNLLLGFTTDSYFLKLQVNGSIFSNNQVLAQGVNAQIAADSSANISPLYISNQSLTGSSAQGLFYGSTTWNTTGNPSLIDLNITNTASGATSNYIKISDGSNIFRVTKAAEVVTAAPTGGSIRKWKLGEAATVSPTSPNRTIRVEIDGTVYYLHAKTTND